MFKTYAYNIARYVAALIMLQTLYFKFTGSPESMYIFRMVGMEPSGRWMVGLLELLASLLLIIPRTAWLGGILSMGLMIGAIGLHLAVLGIEIMNDGGYLFMLGVIVLLCSFYVIFANKEKILSEIIPKILNRK